MLLVTASRVNGTRVLSANTRHENIITRVDDFSANHAPMTVLTAVMRVGSSPNCGGGFHVSDSVIRFNNRFMNPLGFHVKRKSQHFV
jgi:hypothetical protein